MAPGGTVTFTLVASDFTTGTTGGPIEAISWDANVLSMTSVVLDPALDDGGFFSNNGTIDNVAGTLSGLNAAPPFPTSISATTFDIATLSFTVDLSAPLGNTNVVLAYDPSSFLVWTDMNYDEYVPQPVLISGTVNIQAVPVPAAVWLFGSGLLGLVSMARRRVI